MKRVGQEDLDRFAARLREWQQNHGLTQQGAAEKIGTSSATYENWLAAKHAPQDRHIGALREACGDYVVAPLVGPTTMTDALRGLTEEQAALLGLEDEWRLAQTG